MLSALEIFKCTRGGMVIAPEITASQPVAEKCFAPYQQNGGLVRVFLRGNIGPGSNGGKAFWWPAGGLDCFYQIPNC